LHVGRLASSHAQLARRIGTELENPLRNYPTSTEFGQFSHYETNLLSLAESQETARQKSEKAKSKGKAKKQEEKAREETDARAHWENEAPLIIEKLQNIDEGRMIMLKDIFVKSMMMEVETSQAAMSETEGIMNALLSLSPDKEVEDFAAAQKEGAKPAMHERRRSILSNNQTFTPSPSASPVSRPSLAPTRSNVSIPEDSGEVRTEKRKSRFGTILRSGRNSILAPGLHLRGSSPDKKRKQSKDTIQPPLESGANLTPVISQTSQNGIMEHPEPLTPVRKSSTAPLEPQRSPTKEGRPMSRDEPSRATEEAEQESIMSSESNYAPPLRVEIMKEAIPEEAGEREAAVSTLQNTLRAQPTISRKSRGRREGRNSTFVPSETDEFGGMALTSQPVITSQSIVAPPVEEMRQMSISSNSPIMSPLTPTTHRTMSPIRQDSDAQSLSSVRTTSRPGGIAVHPNLETPGFNVSILEMLSAMFSSDGKVQKTFVMGEVALSNHGERVNSIQISHGDSVQQIIANKAILTENGRGSYTLIPENLPPKGAIALKYKAAISRDPQTFVPLLLRAMWKIEQGSVSVMIGYQLNPAITGMPDLSNVVFSVTLPNDSHVLGCQSKPQGQFSKERGQLIWHIPAVQTEEQILLAKFSSDGLVSRNGSIEAKWECRGVILSGIEISGAPAKDPFADEEDGAVKANVLKGLISGKYYCQA